MEDFIHEDFKNDSCLNKIFGNQILQIKFALKG